LKPETNNKVKKLYNIIHPALWMLVGASIIYATSVVDLNLSTMFLQESDYKSNGKFACWYFDELDYSNLSEFETDVIQAFQKHCIDMPKP